VYLCHSIPKTNWLGSKPTLPYTSFVEMDKLINLSLSFFFFKIMVTIVPTSEGVVRVKLLPRKLVKLYLEHM
jgi:hypothetical protein